MTRRPTPGGPADAATPVRRTLRCGVLILVRHGQTQANARGLFLGRSDPPLTPVGQAQAQVLARTLPSPARVVSSPLQRAVQTATAFGRAVQLDERWIEMDYGSLDGSPVSSVPDDVRRRWHRDAAFAPGDGEPLTSVARRVRAACDELIDEARVGDVLVVSHVSPIKAAVAWALGVAEIVAWRMWLDDAAVCRIRIDPDGAVLAGFNETVAARQAP